MTYLEARKPIGPFEKSNLMNQTTLPKPTVASLKRTTPLSSSTVLHDLWKKPEKRIESQLVCGPPHQLRHGP